MNVLAPEGKQSVSFYLMYASDRSREASHLFRGHSIHYLAKVHGAYHLPCSWDLCGSGDRIFAWFGARRLSVVSNGIEVAVLSDRVIAQLDIEVAHSLALVS